MRMMLTPLALLALATAAPAQETRELSAHEHGHSALDIAFDGNRILIDLTAPGADIVGFEYEAETVEDRARIDAAIAELSKPLSLFAMPNAAGCSVSEASASLVAEHGEDHEGEHADTEMRAESEGHGDEAEHAEFQAAYLLTCANPEAIDTIDFPYFETFTNSKEIDVQMISDIGSRGFEVERDNPTLDLAGQT